MLKLYSYDRRVASKLPRPVWLLGWVSLATDAATEAVYPILPFFLTTVLGAGAVSLGIIEGAAEATNSLLKIFAGRLADRAPSKRPLVLFGYTLSSLARPFIAIAMTWTQVFAVRVLDRVGKGVRGAPRDAILASWATPDTRGKVFGFHQGMDHIGAVVGPVLATLFLLAYPGHYRSLFALTIIPGVVAIALVFFIREDRAVPAGVRLKPDAAVLPGDTTSRDPQPSSDAAKLNRFMAVSVLFTLGNSTDAFLLLRLTNVAGTVRLVPLMWAALHVVKASVSMIGGSWSDRVGRRAVIALGWMIYAVVYGGFAFSTTLPALFGWFLLYGFYYGFAEGTGKALVADLAPAARRGFAFGLYDGVLGFGALAASVIFGLVWTAYGTAAAFGIGSALALTASALLFVVV